MLKLIELEAPRTYITRENAIKAVEKKLKYLKETENLRYIITVDKTGRFFPVFIGQEAIQSGVHFHFNVLG